MRTFNSESHHVAAEAGNRASHEISSRTRADFKTLLLELARAERGFQFYDEADSRRGPLADRAHRAVVGEIRRAGPIDFTVDETGFRLRGSSNHVELSGALVDFEAALARHNLDRVQMNATLTRTALAGFLDLLGHDAERYPSPELFTRILAARDYTGLRINRIEDPNEQSTPQLISTPPRVAASVAAAHPNPLPRPSTPSPPTKPAKEKPTLESHPLEAPSADDRGERLRARLIELEATVEDDAYCERIADVVVWAEELARREQVDDCYRAEIVLADHAVGMGGRTAVQARAAAASFAKLTSGQQLEDLIRRATGSDGIRAAQLLLQLGADAVPSIFEKLCEEEDPDRAAPLRALLLTQGESAIPHLLAMIQDGSEKQARTSIRLAGDLQNPVMLPALLSTLEVPDLTRRLETIRALSFLPGDASKKALTDALADDIEEIAAAASEALALTDGNEAVPSLLDVLEATLHTGRTHLARTLIEILGRLGDERAVPRLVAILERRPVLRRAHWHAVQLATVDALVTLPTKEARRAIERAAQNASRAVRDRAVRTLKRVDAER